MFYDANAGDMYLTRNRRHAVKVTSTHDGIQGQFIEHGGLTIPTHIPVYIDAMGTHRPEHIYSWWPDGAFRKGHVNDVDLLEKIAT